MIVKQAVLLPEQVAALESMLVEVRSFYEHELKRALKAGDQAKASAAVSQLRQLNFSTVIRAVIEKVVNPSPPTGPVLMKMIVPMMRNRGTKRTPIVLVNPLAKYKF